MEEKIKILIVDDEPDIRTVLRLMLEAKGYEVYDEPSGMDAVGFMKTNKDVDLIIMDIMMPGISGVEACRLIRETGCTVPVLFLTARTQEDDKLQAYSSGGDDYLGKPFSKAELLAKVTSLIRRYREYKGKPDAPVAEGIVLDRDKTAVIRDGERIELTHVEYNILKYLMDNRGEAISAQRLYEGVWQERYLPSSSNTVMVHILNLRKKIEQDAANPRIIHTVWGKGYQID